jgi:hypothetical protein
MTSLAFKLLHEYFYWIDFAIGTSMLIVVFSLYKTKVVSRYIWRLFWLGFGLGLCWEVPLSVLNAYSKTCPPARFITPLPTHFSVLIVEHSFWDGGLFLIGVFLLYLLDRKSWFSKFSLKELLLFMLWGQLSELWVELTSTFNQGWAYNVYWWNPSLFRFNGLDITLLPQLIWLVAPVVYYLVAIKMKRPE